MKELKIKKTTLNKLSSTQMKNVDGGMVAISDSINTKFTDINVCCDGSTCHTQQTKTITIYYTEGC